MTLAPSRTPFVKWYTDDWIAGTIDLSFEEKGFYFELLLRMWERKDHLPNDERWIACALGCNPRTVRKLLAALLAKGKLVIDSAGCIANNRMMREISTHLQARSGSNSSSIEPEFGSNSSGTQAKNQEKSKAAETQPESRSQKPERDPPLPPRGGTASFAFSNSVSRMPEASTTRHRQRRGGQRVGMQDLADAFLELEAKGVI